MVQKQKTVLIVDDDEGMRDTLTAILKRVYRVLRVSSGEAALPILNREDVDLMLLDIRLPGISGFEVLRIVKENYSLIEVIMISAINEVETVVQAMKHGAYHYITKDFDYDQLRSLVGNAAERQDLNRQVLTLSAQVADQGDRDIEAPLQAAGELEHPIVAPVVEADQVDHLVHRPGVRVVTGVHPDRLGHGEVEVNPGGLQDDADTALQPGPVAARILAQDADLAAVPGAVPLENLDGGGLARPVRAE